MPHIIHATRGGSREVLVLLGEIPYPNIWKHSDIACWRLLDWREAFPNTSFIFDLLYILRLPACPWIRPLAYHSALVLGNRHSCYSHPIWVTPIQMLYVIGWLQTSKCFFYSYEHQQGKPHLKVTSEVPRSSSLSRYSQLVIHNSLTYRITMRLKAQNVSLKVSARPQWFKKAFATLGKRQNRPDCTVFTRARGSLNSL